VDAPTFARVVETGTDVFWRVSAAIGMFLPSDFVHTFAKAVNAFEVAKLVGPPHDVVEYSREAGPRSSAIGHVLSAHVFNLRRALMFMFVTATKAEHQSGKFAGCGFMQPSCCCRQYLESSFVALCSQSLSAAKRISAK
jgi:hypothetical protein